MDRAGDAQRLRRLYNERVPKGMTQAEFGEVYGIGTQGMVWQLLSGYRPLSFETAAKFAKGLRCTIADISPDMARAIKTDILPVLGRVAVKSAIFFLMAIPPLVPSPAQAAFNIIGLNMHWLAFRWNRARA